MTESSGGTGAGALDRPATVPLTGMQRARPLANCVPFVFFVLLIALYLLASLTVWRPLIGPSDSLLLLFLGVALLITGREGLQYLRDARAGVALMDEDLLEYARHPTRSSATGTDHPCRFARPGRMHMSGRAFWDSLPGLRHRIVYSPVSRTVWRAEPQGGLEQLLDFGDAARADGGRPVYGPS